MVGQEDGRSRRHQERTRGERPGRQHRGQRRGVEVAQSAGRAGQGEAGGAGDLQGVRDGIQPVVTVLQAHRRRQNGAKEVIDFDC